MRHTSQRFLLPLARIALTERVTRIARYAGRHAPRKGGGGVDPYGGTRMPRCLEYEPPLPARFSLKRLFQHLDPVSTPLSPREALEGYCSSNATCSN
jgi:hypothetical protein